jgi:hypothetical protein
MRARTKTVTRRKGEFWAKALKPGDLVCAVEKSQGIKKGGLVRLGVIRVVSVRVQALNEMLTDERPFDDREEAREGFPEMSPEQFVAMFCQHMGGDSNQTVTRIEFEFTDEATA